MIEIEDLLGCPTETVHICASPPSIVTQSIAPAISYDNSSIDVVLIPGNPGTVVFYIDFMHQVAALFRDTFPTCNEVRVHGLSHANHHLKPIYVSSSRSSSSSSSSSSSILPSDDGSSNFASYGLEFQILHSLEFICRVVQGAYDSNSISISSSSSSGQNKGMRKLFLIGHSIGAYIILDGINKLNQRGDSLIKNHLSGVINLMPFIFWQNIPLLHKASLKTFIWSAPLSSGLVTRAASSLANSSSETKHWAVSALSEYKKDILLTGVIADRMISSRFVSNFLTMGMEEIVAVPENEARMKRILLELQSSCVPLFFLYTDNDVWAPSADMDEVKASFTSCSSSSSSCSNGVAYVPGISHAFTLKPGASDVVISKLASFLIKLSLRSRL